MLKTCENHLQAFENSRRSCKSETSALKLALYFNPTNYSSARNIRSIMETMLSHHGPDIVEPTILALHEAISNCMKHAKSEFQVFLSENPSELVVTVTDWGNGYFDGNLYQPPPPGTQTGKLGVLMIRELMDDCVWIRSCVDTAETVSPHLEARQLDFNGTTLVMRKHLSCP